MNEHDNRRDEAEVGALSEQQKVNPFDLPAPSPPPPSEAAAGINAVCG